MTIRDFTGFVWIGMMASCSGGGSAKVVDARASDGAAAADAGSSRDTRGVAVWDGAVASIDQGLEASTSADADVGASDALGSPTPKVAPGGDLGPSASEAGRNDDLGFVGASGDVAFAATDVRGSNDVGSVAMEVGRDFDVAAFDAEADDLSLDLLDLVAGADAPDESPISANLYYIDPAGSDTVGDGSAAHPWRTVTAAAARIDYSRGLPTLTIAAGTYDEKIVLHDSIVLVGAGSDKVTIKNSDANDTDYVITADGIAPSVSGAVTVTMTGLYVNGLAAKNRGIAATQATIHLDDVNVYQPSGYGISIGANVVGFAIDHTTVGFQGMLYSDIGIDVGNGSSGSISHFTGGDHIDHIINIGLGCTVDISDSQLTGSPIWYADGIRIQGASKVTIRNTTIVRPPGSDPASAGPVHNPPYAGIEVAASSNGNAQVSVDGCTLRGFDVGIGVNLMFNQLLVQNNTIAGNTSADVRTVWAGTGPAAYPVVDLGGGSLGSVGNNDFGDGSEYAVDLGGPYDVSAKNDLWSGTAIETRIHDQLDDPQLGRVQY